jgi:hypothetical protein
MYIYILIPFTIEIILFVPHLFCLFLLYVFPHPFISLFFPSYSISLSSIFFPFRLHSVFLPILSVSLISLHPFHMFSIVFLSPHSTFCTFFPLLLSKPVFSLLVRTSKYLYHFSFFCTLSPQVLRNFLSHTSFILPVVSGFFHSFPSFLLVCDFVPFFQLYIHPSSFCS